MMEALMNKRLEMFRSQLEELVVRAEAALETGNSEVSLSASLKMSVERYVKEIHIYLSNTANPNEENIIEHTKLQMRAEETLARLQCKVSHPTTTRLPKLELLKFKGDILKWAEFWDRFCASVHYKDINKVDKFSYLQACLEGEAEEALAGLEMTDINYDIAVKTLQERFGRKAFVIDAHYSELFKLVRKDNTIRESRKIFNEIERHLRVLQTLGENIEGYHLRTIIMDKFPEDIVKELRICMKSEDESVGDIRKHISRLIQAREGGPTSKETVPTSPESYTTETLHVKEQYCQDTSRPSHNKTALLKRKGNTNRNRNKPYNRPQQSCIFCKGAHFNDECKKISSVDERKKRLGKRCFICFKDNHFSNTCKMDKKCAHCGMKNHNRALCPNGFSSETSN